MVTRQRQKTKAACVDQLLPTEINALPGDTDFLFDVAGTGAELDAQLLQGSGAFGLTDAPSIRGFIFLSFTRMNIV